MLILTRVRYFKVSIQRIFAVHQYNDFSGSPKVLSDALTALTDKGSNITLLTSLHEGFLSKIKCKKIFIPYLRFNYKLLILLSYFFNQFLLFFILGFQLVLSKYRGEQPIVLVNTVMPFSAVIVAKILSVPSYCYIHEVSVKPKILFSFLRFICVRFSTHMICVSKFMISELKISKYSNVTVISNSVGAHWLESHLFNTAEKKLENPQVLMVTSLKVFKGIEKYIQLSKLNPHIRFAIALNCETSEFLDFESEYKSSNFIPYHRPSTLKQLYASSMCILNLSDQELCVETFGLTLVEGMCYGCVPIGPLVGGPSEIINNDIGLKVNPNDLDVLSYFIQKLTDNPLLFEGYYDRCLIESKKYMFDNYRSKFCKCIGVI